MYVSSSRQTKLTTSGSNAHVILDQYEPWKTHQAPTQNGTTVKNGIPNNPVLSQGMKAKNDHQPNFVNHMESSLCRRLFTFSANDKLSLKTQMADTGENYYLPFA